MDNDDGVVFGGGVKILTCVLFVGGIMSQSPEEASSMGLT